MKIIKNANGSTSLSISFPEWEEIGLSQGWMTERKKSKKKRKKKSKR
jgi:hypothetical protein